MGAAQPSGRDQDAESVVWIDDVTHRYKKVVALDHISLEIPSGRMVRV